MGPGPAYPRVVGHFPFQGPACHVPTHRDVSFLRLVEGQTSYGVAETLCHQLAQRQQTRDQRHVHRHFAHPLLAEHSKHRGLKQPLASGSSPEQPLPHRQRHQADHQQQYTDQGEPPPVASGRPAVPVPSHAHPFVYRTCVLIRMLRSGANSSSLCCTAEVTAAGSPSESCRHVVTCTFIRLPRTATFTLSTPLTSCAA